MSYLIIVNNGSPYPVEELTPHILECAYASETKTPTVRVVRYINGSFQLAQMKVLERTDTYAPEWHTLEQSLW